MGGGARGGRRPSWYSHRADVREPAGVRVRGVRRAATRRVGGDVQPGVEGSGDPARRCGRRSGSRARRRGRDARRWPTRCPPFVPSSSTASCGRPENPFPSSTTSTSTRCWCSVPARPAYRRRYATRTGRSATQWSTGSPRSGSPTAIVSRWQLPPVHILGLLNIVTAVAAGARVRLHPRFDLDASLRAIAEERMTLEMAVAPIALGMANHPRLEDFDLTSLRYIMWGATPVAEEVARTVTRRSGVRWLPAYGTSEVPVIAANPVQAPDAVAPRQRRLGRARGRAADRRSGDRRGARRRRDRRDRGTEPVGHGGIPPGLRDGTVVPRRLVPHGRHRLARALRMAAHH